MPYANKEKGKEYIHQYYLKNRSKLIKVSKDWYSQHKKYVLQQKKKRYKKADRIYKCHQKNYKELLNESLRERRKKNPWTTISIGAKQRCTNSKNKDFRFYGGKGIKFKLTVEEIKSLWFRDKASDLKRPSIDRVKSDGDYEYTNCRFIELSENISRATNKKRRAMEKLL